MGLLPTALRFLIRQHKRVGFQGPVLTLGNQDIWASYDQLKAFFREEGCPYFEPDEIAPHTSHLFKDFMPGISKDFVHAKTFFQMLGIKDYWDIDKFNHDQPRLLHDLNEPIPGTLRGKFNLIVDGGTIEHVFDVRQTMENIVRMCRVSGWVVHFSPTSNFVDHGFYSFSPCFFYDFYSANGFDEFVCYVWQASPNPKRYLSACPYFEYSYGMDFDGLLDPQRTILIFFAARKVHDAIPITAPIQGAYVKVGKNINVPLAPVPSMYQRLPGLLQFFLQPVRLFLRSAHRQIRPAYQRLKRI